MSDYEKLKATELKTLLKERGIAATGLTKKAQYIQALEEEDAKTGGTPAGENVGTEKADAPASATEDVVKDAAQDEEEAETHKDKTETKVIPAETTHDDGKDTVMAEAEPDASSERKRKRDPTPMEEDIQGSTPKKAKPDEEQASGETQLTMTEAGAADARDKTSASRSLHSPTAALYIKNLMRPLQYSSFKDHLSSLAGAGADTVANLHLDSMKTHAFAVFATTAAAQTVRNRLHETVWPAESQRKALWVDFVPEDQVKDWIEQENSASRDARFELAYSEKDDGTSIVTLEELGGRPQQRQAPGQGMPGAPQGPRGQRQQDHDQQDRPEPRAEPRRPLPPQQQAQQQGGSFSKLDQYFNFTTSRPKIYFKPVEDELAKQRVAELDRETSRDWRGGKAWNRSTRVTPIDQLRRYTFEDGDKVVDGGVDFGGFGKRQFAGGTGPFIPNGPPRGRGGRGGGGYRGGY